MMTPNVARSQGGILSIFVLAGLFLGTNSACANSLILEELATISSVKVVVPTGGLQYRPPDGIEVDQLEHSIRSVVERILQENGIQVLESSDQQLAIEVGYLRGKNSCGEYPFVVLLELSESARLFRNWSYTEEDQSTWVTTWRDLDLRSAPRGLLAEKIVEAAEFGVEHFVEKVTIARSFYERKKSSQ